MRQLYLIALFLFTSGITLAKLPSNVKKLVGTWEYKEGSGFESWRLEGDVLVGEAFRINKLNDTIVAEQFKINKVDKNLVLHLDAYQIVNDSLEIRERKFLGGKRKLKFTNIESESPISLHYKFGIFSKNKLKIFITILEGSKPQKLTLFRQKS